MRILVFILFTFICRTAFSQDCDDSALNSGVKRLEKSITEDDAISGLKQADSLLLLVSPNELLKCKQALNIQYYRAKALELLREYDNSLSILYTLITENNLEGWDFKANVYLSIALIHEKIGRPQDCLRNLRSANQYIQKHDLDSTRGRYAVRYSSYHRIYDNKDTAQIFAKQAIIYGKMFHSRSAEVDGYLLMGILQNKKLSAIDYYRKAINLFLEDKNYIGATAMRANMASVFLDNKKLDSMKVQLDIGIKCLNEKAVKDESYYSTQSYLFDLKKKYFKNVLLIDSALYYFEKSQEFSNRSKNLTDQKTINETEIKNALAIERRQIKKLQDKEKWFRILLSIGSFVILGLGSLIFMIIKNRKKISHQNKTILSTNKELQSANNKQSVLLSEIHHRVKNNLQLIISLIQLHQLKDKTSNPEHLLDDITNKIKSISLIHDQLYQKKEFDNISLQLYLDELFNHFRTLAYKSRSFTYNIEIESISLNLETTIPLGIICSELISNSIKHAHENPEDVTLTCKIKKTNDRYYLYYKDNGAGYDSKTLDKQNAGLGTLIIKSMARQLDTDYRTYTDDGAVFEINFIEKFISKI